VRISLRSVKALGHRRKGLTHLFYTPLKGGMKHLARPGKFCSPKEI
jgi:hypothetical protein